MAEQEIIAAAAGLLRERPFRELTVDEVMRRTDLSRPSFYVYFRDRHHLVLRVVEHIGGELFTVSDRWDPGERDGRALVHTATEGVVGAFKAGAQVFRRGGIRGDMTNSHSDHFVRNLLAIRWEERLALAVLRPSAFGKVTTLTT